MNIKNLSLVFVLFALNINCLFAQGDFFWSFSDLNEGAVNNDVIAGLADGSHTVFLYYDISNSELDTGAFLDIIVLGSGVTITGGQTFDYDIEVNGTDIGDRWGDSFGPGTVDDGVLSINAFSVVGGTGLIDANTGPAILDAGYDQGASAFLFARVDFDLAMGGLAEFAIEAGSGGIVHNGQTINPSFGSAIVFDATIPEPTTTGLLALGLIGLVARRRR